MARDDEPRAVPVAPQELSTADRIKASLLKRAEGMGAAEKNACRDDIRKKFEDKTIELKAWEQNLDLVTYVDAGGWPSRLAIPKYQSSLVLIEVSYKGEKTATQALLSGLRAGCMFNREGKRFVFIMSCLPYVPCKLP